MQNTKATETEREITRMVKKRGLDPAVWCWVGVDEIQDAFAYKEQPSFDGASYNPFGNESDCDRVKFIGIVETTEPQLFKFNPFYDEETN